jgi:GTPase SAR1 family protein
MKKINKTTSFKFNKNQSIGAPDAESDRIFDKVFVNNSNYEALRDIESSKCIIIGRTGSGKSALIRKLTEDEIKVKRIAPESMSIRYLSNSTILDYLRSINVNLNLFYKILWKHVFIIEVLKLYVDDSEQKKQSLLENLRTRILNRFGKSDLAKKAAIEYLEKWSTDEFWLTSEHRIKTLSKVLESKLSEEIGIKIQGIGLKDVGTNGLTTTDTTEVKYKAEKVISEFQAQALYDLIELLKSEVFTTTQKRYFIVVDDLDKDWVDQQIVYDLIAAMIEVVKEFQSSFQGVKIILALRDNLHQLVLTGREHRGGQREKYSAMYLNLNWSREMLSDLLAARIKQISHGHISINNLFDSQIKNEGLTYIIERTYYRPRDVISYVNKIIEQADNKSHFTKSIIKKAEPFYSTERMHALEDEWEENYGRITKICQFLIGVHNGVNVKNIKEDSFSDLYLSEDFLDNFKGRLREISEDWRLDAISFDTFRKHLLYILYRIGIIGIKRTSENSVQYYYDELQIIDHNDFANDAKIYVHKSLYSYFKVNVKAQEIDVY